ncbi:CoA pyrophosphatase [Roseovarius sp.]|uniref:CoA pyrophosphatase n=1 Tax=Roseovarius sp. TaxID=1486281 RepID=UPI003D11AC76
MTSDLIATLRGALQGDMAPSSDYDLNPDVVLPEGRKLRPAGVLVPIEVTEGSARLWLTKRSSALQHHPGQVAFPGGKQEDGDAHIVAAALREAHEEIGLDPDKVEVLGTLPPHETVTSFHVTPVIGMISGLFSPVPEAGEVEEVFSVPLEHVLELGRFRVESRRWRGTRRHYFAVPYGPYYIWGATARMLRAMAEAVRLGA